MKRENTTTAVDLQKIIDYIFHDISKNEEKKLEDFLDQHEHLALAVDALLDFCLQHQYNKASLRFFMKMNAAPALNNILNTIETELDEIYTLQEALETVTKKNFPTFERLKKAGKFVGGSVFVKAVFTFLLVINVPFLSSNNQDVNHSSLLKASNKQQMQELMQLTDYEVRYMRVDMLDDRPITDFMTAVAVPSSFEIRYITAD